MLKKFRVFVRGNSESLYAFQVAIERMGYNRRLYKKNFNYFKGMRDNWFPLVLLEDLKNLSNVNPLEQAKKEETFTVLMGYAEYQSYYIDDYVKKGDTIIISVRGRDAGVLEKMLGMVISNYNLDCSYRVIS